MSSKCGIKGKKQNKKNKNQKHLSEEGNIVKGEIPMVNKFHNVIY
jgi:hypothetical protein